MPALCSQAHAGPGLIWTVLGGSAHMALHVRQDVECGRGRRVAEAPQRLTRRHRSAARQAQLRHDLVNDLA